MDESTIWDDENISSNRGVPAELHGIYAAAKELLLASIEDAKNITKKNKEWMTAVDWLFYSKDDLPWSMGWVLDVLSLGSEYSVTSAQARINMLKNGELLDAKQEFDLMIAEKAISKNRNWKPAMQMELLTGTC